MTALHFVKQGNGPVVVLSHALGCELGMWDAVAEALQGRFTVLRYDHRGHGRSPATPGAFTMDDLADDAADLIAREAGGAAHFVGLSMGGMAAQALAARHPQRVKSIAVANSAMHYDDAARTNWAARVQTVLGKGMAAISEGAMQRWFTPEYMADQTHGGAARVAELRARLEATDPKAYAAACDAVAGIDFRESNKRIRCPALMIAGARDEATPPAMSEAMAQTIPGAQLATIAASHLSAVELPQEFAKLVADFVAQAEERAR